ncbi:antibiotic biosynthesis monooxygenase family protein [Rathayibacter tanaceti]|uniref:Antibiotic biosynthesis monooxygenase n=2 Tax=Rathayibacter tanaceti TaxID=1671680 RepID=A0A166HE91_9MICO|nr:antibiotic biosynthesis monooxygenase [Rathayibacter tanaceti]KZX20445.1 Antibiotic biosynthesis monooxygenase [Rathayibacter tanaceti]QHC54526.1 antibiotic biosynthesis monooxygenase [Rathayibacter tanaceti]TCO33920.1 heme-degrading monooxygenase HmoA [Rathayibacter tanaceti]
MLQIATLDSSTPISLQHEVETGPVTIINTFVAPEGAEEEVLAAWAADAEYMKRTGNLLAVQLYRGIAGSRLFTNVAVWASPAALKAAARTDEFAAHAAAYPDGTLAYPHLYQKVAVEGICAGE